MDISPQKEIVLYISVCVCDMPMPDGLVPSEIARCHGCLAFSILTEMRMSWQSLLVAKVPSKQPETLSRGTKFVLHEVDYVIEEHLGRGGFGSVFKVSRKTQAGSLWVLGCT